MQFPFCAPSSIISIEQKVLWWKWKKVYLLLYFYVFWKALFQVCVFDVFRTNFVVFHSHIQFCGVIFRLYCSRDVFGALFWPNFAVFSSGTFLVNTSTYQKSSKNIFILEKKDFEFLSRRLEKAFLSLCSSLTFIFWKSKNLEGRSRSWSAKKWAQRKLYLEQDRKCILPKIGHFFFWQSRWMQR